MSEIVAAPQAGLAAERAPDAGPGSRLRRRFPLSLKLAVAFVGLVTVVLLINGAVNVWLNYEQSKRAAIEVQKEKARGAAERVEGFLSEIENEIGWTTRVEWSHIGTDQQRYDFIRLLRQAPAVTEVSYIDPAGKEQLKVSRLEPDTVGSGKDFSADPRFKQAIADKVWFGPVYFRRGSEPYMTIAIAHAGRDPGVTVADVNLKLIWDVITAIRVGEKGYAFVVTAAGRLIADPDLSLVLRDTDLAHLPQVAEALSDAGHPDDAASGPDIVTDVAGQKVLSAHAVVARVGWIVFVQSPLSEALAPVYAALLQTSALLGLGILLATILGTVMARRLVVPIRRLQQGAERLGGGDLSERIVIRTGDEIETLADRFNTMASRVQESYATLEERVDQRTRDLNQALEQQTATADVLKVISRSQFDLKAVFKTLVESAVRLCASDGSIYLRHGDVYLAEATFDTNPETLKVRNATPQRAGRDSAVSRVALSGAVEQIPDDRADPEFAVPSDARFDNVRSRLGVPLLRAGQVEGVFVLGRSEPGPFTARQVDLVQTFADQAVIAVENARLFEQVRARTHELSEALEHQTATSDVLSVINRSPDDLQPVLDTIVATAYDLCHAQYALFFRRAEDGLYHLASSRNADQSFIKWLRDHPIAEGDGTATGLAALERETVHLRDALSDPRFTDLHRQRKSKARTQLAVPLIRAGSVVGVVFVARTAVEPFTERQVGLVTTFAEQAVIAVNNVGLFNEVQARTRDLQMSIDELRSAQDRLVQSEKLASLGQLTAGIAHEIKNPLNFINNFSALSGELLDELQDALRGASLDAATRDEVEDLTGLLKGNLAKVVQHGQRADSIVKNMLLHSRTGSGDHRPVDLNGLVEESVNLAYHGARAERPGFDVTITKTFDPEAGQVDLYPQEITRVLLNLVSNGFYAAAKRRDEGGEPGYEPALAITTSSQGSRVEIRIRDNGTGIPEEVKAKMFNPFFTTKPAGEGTGLGLSLSHDIVVKQHGGAIDVETEPGAFTEFTIRLPRGGPPQNAREAKQ